MWWLFYSQQKSKERTASNAVWIVARLALVFAVTIGVFHHLLAIPIATLLFPLIVTILWSSLVTIETPPGDGILEILLWTALVIPFFLTREFVLGFPVRKELVLEPIADNRAIPTLDHLHNLNAIVTSPLRPTGTVQIDGSEYAAKSSRSTFIENGSLVIVLGNTGRILVVDSLTNEAEQRDTEEPSTWH